MQRVSSPGLKRPGRDADHSPPFSAEFQELNLGGEKGLFSVLGFELRLLVTHIVTVLNYIKDINPEKNVTLHNL